MYLHYFSLEKITVPNAFKILQVNCKKILVINKISARNFKSIFKVLLNLCTYKVFAGENTVCKPNPIQKTLQETSLIKSYFYNLMSI